MATLRFVCWNLERNGAGDPEIRRAAAETLRSLQPDIVLRQEMFRADERGHTIFNEQCRALDMQGVLGPGACTAILFNPRRLNLVRDWSGDRGPHFVLPPTAITLSFPQAGPDASPFNVVSFHFAYASAEQRQLEAEWTTTWADKGWQAPDGSRHVLPAIFGGDGNSYPEPGTAGDLPLADLSAIQDRPHRLHRSRRGPDGVRVPDTEPDNTLRTAGLEDVARYWAEKGNPAALARTVDATETHSPDSRIDRVYFTTGLLPAVTGVEVHEVPLGVSDHHIPVATVDSSVFADVLSSYPRNLSRT
ncbi:endonuclease/exonuclease/phosphatase family protein [Streptomyces sp. ME02-6991-2A]|uniref:endonuclease/exonuclease/phosphatase family protein n=1 Tax=Streptomyces TaxID=1883 RepID=UPI0029A9A7E2|nr:endonuclease/exonuclease/phosphatase family protein [Streptomyces sp. ME02-6991-2A]MDX3376492.1 endonuclease/exonuclease/phosphatase family protein [Streptomyces sp. ME02-6991-2A]WTA93619.1 endonuclease/exonuclease/phosphatase family protein [Streptomyces cyaneofuscatus]